MFPHHTFPGKRAAFPFVLLAVGLAAFLLPLLWLRPAGYGFALTAIGCGVWGGAIVGATWIRFLRPKVDDWMRHDFAPVPTGPANRAARKAAAEPRGWRESH
jgi:hypothetical protein